MEYDVPALIHSAGCRNGRETYSDHFITEESLAVTSLLRSSALADFPGLKLIIGHGGGSVPYQIGRWQAARLSPGLGEGPDAERFETSLRRLWFDTVLYNKTTLELLFKPWARIGACSVRNDRAAARCRNPDTGRSFDDLKPDIDEIAWLSDEDRRAIFEGNVREAFPRWSPR